MSTDVDGKSGFLGKEGGGRLSSGIRRRWMVLSPGERVLRYYKKAGDKKEAGQIPLSLPGLEVRHAATRHKKKPHCIEVFHPTERTFYLIADTEEERLDWTKALLETIKGNSSSGDDAGKQGEAAGVGAAVEPEIPDEPAEDIPTIQAPAEPDDDDDDDDDDDVDAPEKNDGNEEEGKEKEQEQDEDAVEKPAPGERKETDLTKYESGSEELSNEYSDEGEYDDDDDNDDDDDDEDDDGKRGGGKDSDADDIEVVIVQEEEDEEDDDGDIKDGEEKGAADNGGDDGGVDPAVLLAYNVISCCFDGADNEQPEEEPAHSFTLGVWQAFELVTALETVDQDRKLFDAADLLEEVIVENENKAKSTTEQAASAGPDAAAAAAAAATTAASSSSVKDEVVEKDDQKQSVAMGHETQPWFFAQMNRAGAEERLWGKPTGTFVVRPSSRPGCLSLSHVEPSGVVGHGIVRLTEDGSGWRIEDSPRTHRSVSDLLAAHSLRLKDYKPKPEPATIADAISNAAAASAVVAAAAVAAPESAAAPPPSYSAWLPESVSYHQTGAASHLSCWSPSSVSWPAFAAATVSVHNAWTPISVSWPSFSPIIDQEEKEEEEEEEEEAEDQQQQPEQVEPQEEHIDQKSEQEKSEESEQDVVAVDTEMVEKVVVESWSPTNVSWQSFTSKEIEAPEETKETEPEVEPEIAPQVSGVAQTDEEQALRNEAAPAAEEGQDGDGEEEEEEEEEEDTALLLKKFVKLDKLNKKLERKYVAQAREQEQWLVDEQKSLDDMVDSLWDQLTWLQPPAAVDEADAEAVADAVREWRDQLEQSQDRADTECAAAIDGLAALTDNYMGIYASARFPCPPFRPPPSLDVAVLRRKLVQLAATTAKATQLLMRLQERARLRADVVQPMRDPSVQAAVGQAHCETWESKLCDEQKQPVDLRSSSSTTTTTGTGTVSQTAAPVAAAPTAPAIAAPVRTGSVRKLIQRIEEQIAMKNVDTVEHLLVQMNKADSSSGGGALNAATASRMARVRTQAKTLLVDSRLSAMQKQATADAATVVFDDTSAVHAGRASCDPATSTRQEWRETFEHFDKDKSGYLDSAELLNCCTTLGWLFKNHELETLMQRHNGRVNFQGFCEFLQDEICRQ